MMNKQLPQMPTVQIHGWLPLILFSLALIIGVIPSLKAQPLVKNTINIDPGNTKLSGATFAYRLAYSCNNINGPCLGAQVVDLLPAGVQYVSTVPASPTGDVAAINVTPNFMGTGRTRVQFVLISPLPMGNSGDLLVNVRFPNGSTPDGTIATNTADAINLETLPGTFTTPSVNATAVATPQANTTITLTTSPANLDLPETYRYRFSVPNVNGALNFTQAGPVTVTLPPGTVFNSATPAADCQQGCVGTTPATVTFTAPFTVPIVPNTNSDILLNVTFPSATFPSGTNVTTEATIDATPLGELSQTFGPATVTHPVTTFVPNPSATFTVNMAGGTPNPPTLNQPFSYDMNITNNGNVSLDNQVVIFTVPVEMLVTSVTTGAYNNLNDFSVGEGVRLSYEKNTALGVFTLWGSSPNATTSTILTAPPPGLGAGEYITRIRWEYGQSQPGMTPTTRPLITGRIINPDNAGGPVAIGDAIQACANLSAVYTAGPTNVNSNDCENFNIAGPFLQFNPAKENLSGGGPFNPGQNVSFRLRVRSASQSSDPVPLEAVIVSDLLPEGLTYNSWTFDDQGTGLPAPQVFDQIPNFAGNLTLLRWQWNAGSGNLGVNQQVWINISVTVSNLAVQGALSNDVTIDSDAPGLSQRCSGASQADLLDFDGDGNTAEILCRATGSITVSSFAAPRVLSIVRNDPSPTGAATVSWRVTFNEDVKGLNAGNFMLVGIPDAMITTVVTENATTEDDVWIVTASTGTGNGTLGLNLVNSTGASDAQFNAIPINPVDIPFIGEVYDIENTPPTGVLTIVNPTIGSATHTFIVTYVDDTSLDISALDNADIRVTGPNGYDVLATFVMVDVNADGTPRIATYEIPAPGGTWDAADAGLYQVALVSNQVADIYGNTNVASVLGSFIVCSMQSNLTLFVDDDAAMGGDGLTWATAFNNLQDALALACNCGNVSEIWVTKGTYYPDEGVGQTDNDRNSTFQLCDGVSIYGGFSGNGTETLLSQRDITANVTILSGDIDKNDADADNDDIIAVGDIMGDNAYHVVNGSGITNTAGTILDGFFITAGKTDAALEGGGMYILNGSPTVSHCTFSGNWASVRGGGLSMRGSTSAVVTNCKFIGNTANSGGGIGNRGGTPIVSNCTFLNNNAIRGGGLYAESSIFTVTNSRFLGNSATNTGGGIAFSSSRGITTNCIFSGNTADYGGGMSCNLISPIVTNCTFSGNEAFEDGGGIYNEASSPQISNSIFYNNTANNGKVFYNTFFLGTGTSNPIISYSLVDVADCNAVNPGIGGSCGAGMIFNGNPLFVDADGADNIFGTLDDDLRLLPTSPAINMGDNAAVPADTYDVDEDSNTGEPTPDLDLNARIFDDPNIANDIVDMGAYEAMTGSIIVSKFHDRNGDGIRNADPAAKEDFLQGWTMAVFADGADPGTDNPITSGQTDANGEVMFNLLTGTYLICEEDRSADPFAWLVTNGTICRTVVIVGGTNDPLVFGNQLQRYPIDIIKDTRPDHPQDFVFPIYRIVDGEPLQFSSRTLDDDADNTLSNVLQFDSDLSYPIAVAETPVPGWKLLDIGCTSLTGNSTFTEGNHPTTNAPWVVIGGTAGDSISCTFVNCLLPTFSGVSIATVCVGEQATVTLTGLNANTELDITYTIGAGAPQTFTATSDANGVITFQTPMLAANDHNVTLTITQIDFTNDANACVNDNLTNNTINLSVNALSSGIVAADQTICSGDDPAAFTSPNNGTFPMGALQSYRWEASTTGCNANDFQTIPNYDPTSITNDIPVGLTQTTYYRRVAISTLNGVACEAISNCVTVTVNDVAGGSIAAAQTICSGDDPAALTSTTAGTGDGTITYRWESSTTSCDAGFSTIDEATGATYDPGALNQTTYYRRLTISTLNGVACEAISNCLVIAVNQINPGEIAGSQTVCITKNPAPFTSITPASGSDTVMYQWESSTTSCEEGFAPIPGATAATFDAVQGQFKVTTYFRRRAISTLDNVACDGVSNCVTLTVLNVDCGQFPWNGN